MSCRHKSTLCCFIFLLLLPPLLSASGISNPSLATETITKQLGWVKTAENVCGYFVEDPITSQILAPKLIKIAASYGVLSQKETSILEGEVTVTRADQQIITDKAFLYRDPHTGKLSVIDLIGNVRLRQPNTLVIGTTGRYEVVTGKKFLSSILYRTTLNQAARQHIDICQSHIITALTAWGEAQSFAEQEPKIYELENATYSTCPPTKPLWQVKASHIVLNKNTGRGYATHGRLLLKNIPILYFPYFNFSIDKQRKTGFLWPKIGSNSKWGPYIQTPFYWNLAPNYDMTIMPSLLSKRGFKLSDNFRYLTTTDLGTINASILPNDRFFAEFQKKIAADATYRDSPNPIIQSELARLDGASTTRKGFFWRNESRFNPNWSSHIDFNYAGDDYYLRDFGSNLNEVTQNQLLQEADIFYQSPHWNGTFRLQAYQTLHPINEEIVLNQYRRLPQLIMNASYPLSWGFDYFHYAEGANFTVLKMPGTDTQMPIGNRLHFQPGVALPIYYPYFFMNPRIQLALTEYNLRQTQDTNSPSDIRRALPIFDVVSGISLTRRMHLFHQTYQHTLEPQIYYTYIPYRDQSDIPLFDTTTNTLVYDQIFNYNRFTGIDRIGDANQIGVGVTTRLIDDASGLERLRFGIGEIIYFAKRRVTLCQDPTICTDNPLNPSNRWHLSPISSLLNYHLYDPWTLSANTIWNPISKQLDNNTIGLHYQTDNFHIFNIYYTYAYNGDVLSGVVTHRSNNNLKVTDISFTWPMRRDVSMMGRWRQDWNERHLQNLFYGIQYDSCCWAVRLVASRTFLSTDPNRNYPKYNNEFYIQVALKGLGNVGDNPTNLLSSISGYNPQFGQEF